MKQSNDKEKNKTKGLGIRWKVFLFMLVPSFLLIVMLWLVQTVFFGLFYAQIKTEELKRATSRVINEVEKSGVDEFVFHISSAGDINIRVIDTDAFDSLYTSGEAMDSVSYGLGSYGMFKLYEQTVENGGEYVIYYREGENEPEGGGNSERPMSPPPGQSSDKVESDSFNDRFRRIKPPGFFEHLGHKNQLLYAKTAQLSDGNEIMVVADTRMYPFATTVSTLRYQLVICSALSVIISLIVSFFISKKISKPIVSLNKAAKKLAMGDFDVRFDAKGFREISQLSDTLNFAAEELGKTEKLRRELLANVSHDMRTPLTMIVGYSEVMRDIPGENTPENVQVIIDEATRLSEFVNSVLGLAKLQNGMDKLELEKSDINDMLEKASNRYSKLLAEDECEIVLESDGMPCHVMCDMMKMTQVLYNLGDNAVNYAGDKKKITFSKKVHDGYVRIEVKDNGDGIAPEELPYIWDRYYKTRSNHTRNTVGSGLGLSIVKEILKQHGARFGVETSNGEGSTFWFEMKIVSDTSLS